MRAGEHVGRYAAVSLYYFFAVLRKIVRHYFVTLHFQFPFYCEAWFSSPSCLPDNMNPLKLEGSGVRHVRKSL
jgi:hypothetical protein